ncbi:MAG: metallophosphoesterase [Bacillota bacterium]
MNNIKTEQQGRIFVTGDTHGTNDFMKMRAFGQRKGLELTKDDFVIIAGDCGIVWSEHELAKMKKLYNNLPFTTLFVDGNHENFDMLNKYPIEQWNCGNAHKISDSIIHLMRGQIFEIYGKKIFTFGGAESTDKEWRTEGKSWWKQETPIQAEYDEAYKNLALHDFKVDYIITHTVDERSTKFGTVVGAHRNAMETNIRLNMFEENVEYTHWWCGHYHADAQINHRKSILYHDIVMI